MGGKFSDAMKAARSVKIDSVEAIDTDLQQAVITDLQYTVNTDLQESINTDDPLVSLTIKVPKSVRQHWQIETRKANTTVTTEVIEFLSKRFGKP
jgi:hypothetical protein